MNIIIIILLFLYYVFAKLITILQVQITLYISECLENLNTFMVVVPVNKQT